jgi:hypothetical protein
MQRVVFRAAAAYDQAAHPGNVPRGGCHAARGQFEQRGLHRPGLFAALERLAQPGRR